jgi:hypothetical protein
VGSWAWVAVVDGWGRGARVWLSFEGSRCCGVVMCGRDGVCSASALKAVELMVMLTEFLGDLSLEGSSRGRVSS